MRWVAAGAVAALALCAACASGAEPAASTASPAVGVPPSSSDPAVPPVPGMAAEVVELRTDRAVGGQVQVRVTATDTFTVTSAALDSPGFEPLPAVDRSTEFEPGRVIDLPVAYGPPICAAAAEPAFALLTVTRGGASGEEVRVPLAAEVLSRIHDGRCTAAELFDLVAVEVVDLRPEGDALTGTLRLTRRSGSDDVHAVRLSRNVLIAATAELPLHLAGDADSASTPVGFSPVTCDPHVLADVKQPYLFPLGVQVGDAEEVVVDLPMAQETRDLLADLVERVCGTGG